MTVAAINTPCFLFPNAPGGQLFTYAAGTVTPLTTYSDAAGSVPNSNPVILDTNGSAIVRGNGSYHLLLKDSAGATTLFDEDSLLYGIAPTGYSTDTGSVNVMAIANTAVQQVAGGTADVVMGHTNTSLTVTLAVNGGSAAPVIMGSGLQPAIGQLVAGQIASMEFNGTSWVVKNLAMIVTNVSGINTNTIPGALIVKGGASTPINNVGNSGTGFTLDLSASNVHKLTMTGNVLASGWNITNPYDGQTFNLFITQGSGPFTLAWPTSFKWAGGSAGAISTANGAVDLLVGTYRADTGFIYVTIGKAFA